MRLGNAAVNFTISLCGISIALSAIRSIIALKA